MAARIGEEINLDFSIDVDFRRFNGLAADLHFTRLRILELSGAPPEASASHHIAAMALERAAEASASQRIAASRTRDKELELSGQPEPSLSIPWTLMTYSGPVDVDPAQREMGPPRRCGDQVGRLEFSDYGDATDSSYDMLFDTGTRILIWMMSQACEAHIQERHTLIDSGPFSFRYVDGSEARKTYRDILRVRPSPHLSADLCEPRWHHVSLGVAHEVTGCFKFAAYSGIVGLGRQMESGGQNPSFLTQIRPRLTSPEMTIALTRESQTRHTGNLFGEPETYTDIFNLGRITFGARPRPSNEVWWENINSTMKRLLGIDIPTPNGLALFDTGSPLCWLDTSLVQQYYSKIVRHKIHAETGIYMVPADSVPEEFPSLELQLGNAMFTLRALYDDHYEPREGYRVGPIQPKSVLLSDYNGPDIIGRTALINMELNLQFPEDGTHRVAWREKEETDIGVGPGVRHI
ncbi:aspartic peptidase domain-containing protein [Mycena pura]|uniref:Aspartic peptidase domain-containing protein n=1 Tax=Mycena pura TaxID=153505 RepID=A0AAD6UTH6_9AGAR|nr:aspartic peptidase domain-containing protein [Mycena pura]